MPTRTKSNRSGDIGEVQVIERFLEIGASVNSLTQSDYGWDLHVHTPKEAMEPNQDKKTWEMSGLAAHVQVKNSQSGSKGKVKVGSLRAWMAGSAAGVPTFVFYIHRGQPRYASPRMLSALLAGMQDKDDKFEFTLGVKDTEPADFTTFNHLLRLWTMYSPLLMNEDVTVDDWLTMTSDQLEEAHLPFLALVWLAWVRANFGEEPLPDKGHYDGTMMPLTMKAWRVLNPGLCDEGTFELTPEFMEFHTEIVDMVVVPAHEHDAETKKKLSQDPDYPRFVLEQRLLRRPSWPEASLGTTYARSTDLKGSTEDGERLIVDVLAFYLLCRERKSSAGV